MRHLKGMWPSRGRAQRAMAPFALCWMVLVGACGQDAELGPELPVDTVLAAARVTQVQITGPDPLPLVVGESFRYEAHAFRLAVWHPGCTSGSGPCFGWGEYEEVEATFGWSVTQPGVIAVAELETSTASRAEVRALASGVSLLVVEADGVRDTIEVRVGMERLPFTAIAGGGLRSCGVGQDHAIYCWGGWRGLTPAVVAGAVSGPMLGVGADQGCWSDAAGALRCENGGSSATMRFGAVSLAAEFSPWRGGPGSGLGDGCGVTTDSVAYCWGLNNYGQLGTEAALEECWRGLPEPGVTGSWFPCAPEPVPVAGDIRWASLDVGTWHVCGLDGAGHRWCWGSSSGGKLGFAWLEGDPAVPVRAADTVAFTALAAGHVHTCGLTVEGRAWCWGSNERGELGRGGADGLLRFQPEPVATTLTFVGIDAGTFTCGLASSGAVYCWGGVLFPATPTLVAGDHVFTALSVGFKHACGLAVDGRPWCWGDNAGGQLGAWTAPESQVLVPVPVMTPVIK